MPARSLTMPARLLSGGSIGLGPKRPDNEGVPVCRLMRPNARPRAAGSRKRDIRTGHSSGASCENPPVMISFTAMDFLGFSERLSA